MLDVMARWNRWGSGTLRPGVSRAVVDRIRPYLDTRDVVALIGPRRAGKTTCMHQLMDLLAAQRVPVEAMLHLNLEEPALGPDLGLNLLEEAWRTYREQVYPTGRAYVFLDEVQVVPGWERWVRSRVESDDLKVFVTGSSSKLLSREFGTLLTGRHVSIEVWPLSFAEALRFRGVAPPRSARIAGSPPLMQSSLSDYLRFGGFPEIVLAQDAGRRETLLKQYFDDVLFKDVAMRHEVRDLTTLRAIAVTLLSSTASLVSLQRLARTFGVSLDLARASCSYLAEAFLVELLPYFSLKAGERTRNPAKVHAGDPGLRNAVCLSGSRDVGRVAETAAVLAARRLPDVTLHYWKGKHELDLLVRRGTRTIAVLQCCYDPRPEGVLDRELAGLAEASLRFRGATAILLHVEPMPRGVDLGSVRAVPLWRFLLEPEAIVDGSP